MNKSTSVIPPALRPLILARVVNRLGAMALPFMTLWLTRTLGASTREAGLVVAGFGLASMVSRVVGGRLGDRWGRRPTVVVGLICSAASLTLMASATALPQGVAGVVLLGLSFEIYESPSQALIADAVEPAARPAAYGALGAALSAAALVAGLMAAALAPLSLRLLFVVDAATCLAATVVVLRWLPAGDRRPLTHGAGTARPGPWRNPLLVRLFAANAVFAACYLQLFVSLPLTLGDRGLPPAAVGVTLTISAATIIAGQPMLRRLPAGLAQPRVAILAGLGAVASGFAGYAVATGLGGFVVATVVVSAGDLLLMGHLTALVSRIAPEADRARHLAAYGLSWGVAATIAPAAGTWLLQAGGDTVLWLAAGGLLAGVAGYLHRSLPRMNLPMCLAKDDQTTKVEQV